MSKENSEKLEPSNSLESPCIRRSNQAITPQAILNDQESGTTVNGVYLRKGTIYATILNIQTLNECFAAGTSSEEESQIAAIIKTINELIPGLHVAGMFELFSLLEWLSLKNGSPGRFLVGLLYLQQYPEQATSEILTQLKNIEKKEMPYLPGPIQQILKSINSQYQLTL